jgi:hypothetical protein
MEGTSDPDARKGVRAQRTRSRSNASKSRAALGPCYFRRPATGSGERDHPRVSQRQGGMRPWRHGTAARGGNSSKGQGVARSEARLTTVRRGSGFQRNAANPRTGSGMQQARRPARGENRRGGEKPRGRNMAGRVVPSARRRPRGNPRSTESGRGQETSVEGRASHEPQERQGPGVPAALRRHRFSPRGTRQLCGRFEGESNDQGVPTKDGSPS